MSEATPRPWHYGVTEQGYFGEGLIGPQGQTVFANTGRGMSDASEADAKLIVRAVNNHDALLAAAKNFVQWADECWGSWAINSEDTPKAKAQYEAAKAAIAAAEANA